MFLDEVYVWEVSTYEVEWLDKEEGDYSCGSCIDNTYLITTSCENNDEFYEALITEADFPLEDCIIQVYCARSASLVVTKKNHAEVYEADCSTGYSGSPVYERCVK